MNLVEIRKTIITAVASDDVLVERLVLKGGNALELVHRIGQRASLDLDFSIEGDFDDPNAIGERLHAALIDRFDAVSFKVFDYVFKPRPSNNSRGQMWGGYNAEFKIISIEDARRLNFDVNAMRIQSLTIGDTTQKRTFTVEISKYEYIVGKVRANVASFDCLVYTPTMIAIEKLRAICQQLPSYTKRRNPTSRPRDFYDIHAIVTIAEVSLLDGVDLLGEMFAVKEVALGSLLEIAGQREFHRVGWPSVENAAREKLRPFDFYFDFVVTQAKKLHPLCGP